MFGHSWPNSDVHTKGTKKMVSPDISMGLWKLRESIRESVWASKAGRMEGNVIGGNVRQYVSVQIFSGKGI